MGTQADVHESDLLATELEAMRQIARALDTLADRAARARVMRWAADRCLVAAPLVKAEVAHGAVVDSNREVEELRDLFPQLHPTPAPPVAATMSLPRVGAESSLRDFVADFRRIALEWQEA